MNLKESTTKQEREVMRQFIRENLSVETDCNFEHDYYGGGSLNITTRLYMIDENGKQEVVSTSDCRHYT